VTLGQCLGNFILLQTPLPAAGGLSGPGFKTVQMRPLVSVVITDLIGYVKPVVEPFLPPTVFHCVRSGWGSRKRGGWKGFLQEQGPATGGLPDQQLIGVARCVSVDCLGRQV
jgi:hypothetical protein